MSRTDALQARADALRSRLDALDVPGPRTIVEQRPLVVLALALVAAQVYAVLRVLIILEPRERLVLQDSVIFEYVGWYLSEGGRLYADIWEVKPPVPFEVAGLLAVVAGDDVLLYHSLLVLATSVAAVGGAVLVGALVHETTGDGVAAVVAGLVPLVFSQYYWRALVGFKAKYFVVFFGLLALYLALRERPLLAGAASALVAGTWQLAVVFPVVALGLTVQRGDRAAVWRYLAGALGATVVVLSPFLVWGLEAVEAMVVEVVLTPLLVEENSTASGRIQNAMLALGRTTPVMLLGVVGLAQSLLPRYVREEWWAPACGAWFTATIVLLDFDSRNDLIPWVAVAAVGVGLLLGRARRAGVATSAESDEGGTATTRSPDHARRAIVVAVVLLAAVSVVTLGGYGTGFGNTDPETYNVTGEPSPALDLPYNETERQDVFWNRVPPETCRVFAGLTQYHLVNRMNLAGSSDVRYFEAECGQWGPAWRAFRRKYG